MYLIAKALFQKTDTNRMSEILNQFYKYDFQTFLFYNEALFENLFIAPYSHSNE